MGNKPLTDEEEWLMIEQFEEDAFPFITALDKEIEKEREEEAERLRELQGYDDYEYLSNYETDEEFWARICVSGAKD